MYIFAAIVVLVVQIRVKIKRSNEDEELKIISNFAIPLILNRHS